MLLWILARLQPHLGSDLAEKQDFLDDREVEVLPLLLLFILSFLLFAPRCTLLLCIHRGLGHLIS